MATESAIESPFRTTPGGREAARQANAAKLAELDRERRALEGVRAHLSGPTPIGEALGFFRGQVQTEGSPSTWRDMDAAEAVAVDFCANTGRYRDFWQSGSLEEMIEEAIVQSRKPHQPESTNYVALRMFDAIDRQFKSEQSDG